MRCFQIEVVVRAVKICWHNRDEVRAILARIRLAEFDSSDLGNCVWFIRRLQWASEQRAFGNWLRRQLRINAGATEEEQLAHASLVRRANDVVLDAQIIEEKFDWEIVVCLYPADICRSQNHDVRPCLGKELGNRRFVTEIEVRSIAG